MRQHRVSQITGKLFVPYIPLLVILIIGLITLLIHKPYARSALDGECGFLAANLYAKSVFGEDALVNISIEKQFDGKLSGYIRIRSKTQGIALSLGDKITLKQKGGS